MKKNNKSIIIAQSISSLITLPEGSHTPAYTEGDIIKRVYRLKREKKGRIRLLFFLTSDDFGALEEVLKGSTRVDYRAVVFLSPGRTQNPVPYHPRIVSVRSSAADMVETSYLIEKGFAELEQKEDSVREDKIKTAHYLDALNDQDALIRIGKMLSLERDSDKLLRTILYLSKKITGSDAGSIFLVEEDPEGRKQLRFKYSHTFSMDFPYEEFTMPLDTNSIAGYVAVTGRVLNIPDVYGLPPDSPVSFNRSFDLSSGYKTISMLVLPMRGSLGTIIGVIQLLNSKEIKGTYTGNEAYEVVLEKEADFLERVVPFEERYESLMEAVAGQAAVALENNRMLKQIEQQFEEFVKASVGAIESRDPATSGHSFRVASMSVKTARILSDKKGASSSEWALNETQLKELELAGLLHDFGKVYIDPGVFLKAKKLYPYDMNNLLLRYSFLHRTLELNFGSETERIRVLGELRERIIQLNEPTVDSGDPERVIEEILLKQEELSSPDLEGKEIPLLTDREIINLSIRRGSLNPEERREIESHVEHTYSFVSKIPWPPEFKNIPQITLTHHEFLDGSGYPRGLKGRDQIPLQGRIMTVADIFDALAASDRPYKKALPKDVVTKILREEAIRGKLDPIVVEAFIEGRVWEE